MCSWSRNPDKYYTSSTLEPSGTGSYIVHQWPPEGNRRPKIAMRAVTLSKHQAVYSSAERAPVAGFGNLYLAGVDCPASLERLPLYDLRVSSEQRPTADISIHRERQKNRMMFTSCCSSSKGDLDLSSSWDGKFENNY